MQGAHIEISDDRWAAVMNHLLPSDGVTEEAAFLFAKTRTLGDARCFGVRDVQFVSPTGFTHRSRYYLELTSTARAEIIKRAHDLGCSLIEVHSHPMQRAACFSWSDLSGFDEFVPHVWWRLRGRPYAAIVATPHSCDGLCWMQSPQSPEQLHTIRTERRGLAMTGLTIENWESINANRAV